jgi:hypothetical protein
MAQMIKQIVARPNVAIPTERITAMNNVTQINPAIAKPVFPIVETEKGVFVHQIDEGCHPGLIRGKGEAAEKQGPLWTTPFGDLPN